MALVHFDEGHRITVATPAAIKTAIFFVFVIAYYATIIAAVCALLLSAAILPRSVTTADEDECEDDLYPYR